MSTLIQVVSGRTDVRLQHPEGFIDLVLATARPSVQIDVVGGAPGPKGDPGDGTAYTAGDGIEIVAEEIAVDKTIVARKFSDSIGDGVATSIAVTHGLETKDIIVAARGLVDDLMVILDWVSTDLNTVTFTFPTAPATDSVRVTIVG